MNNEPSNLNLMKKKNYLADSISFIFSIVNALLNII